jgi:hypothetical protein
MAGARIAVERDPTFIGSEARVFSIVVDGKSIGAVRRGETVTLDSSPGKHELYVTSDGRVRSPSVELELTEGEEVRVWCSSPKNPVANIYRLFFRPSRTLEIEVLSR